MWFASIMESLTKDDTAKLFAEKLSDEGKELTTLSSVFFVITPFQKIYPSI